MTCPFGLTETAVPLKLGRKSSDISELDRVLRHIPVKSDTTKVNRELAQHGVRFTNVITAVTGYIFGFVGTVIWNRLHR